MRAGGERDRLVGDEHGLARLLRRPGPTSMPQAVSSLPSMAKATGPVTRFWPLLVVEDRLERRFGRIHVGRGPDELDLLRPAPGSSAGAASTLNSVSAPVPLIERPGPVQRQVRVVEQFEAEAP